MTGLLRAELLRLTSRRVVRWLFAGAIVVILLVQGIAFAKSSKHLKTVPGSFSVAVTEDVTQLISDKCRARHGDDEKAYQECVGVELAQLTQPGVVDKRYDATRLLPDVARAVVVGVAIIGFIVGATSIGGEWGAGTMQALLFWETRRVRVVLAKAAALVAVLLAFLVVAEVVGLATTVLNGALRGITDGIDGSRWATSLLGVARGAWIVTFTGLFGFAVAGLARITAAALGVSFVYFVILENLVRGLRPGWIRFLVSDNIAAVLTKGADIRTVHTGSDGNQFETVFRLTTQRASLTLAVYLVVLVGAFVVSFQRRDVT